MATKNGMGKCTHEALRAWSASGGARIVLWCSSCGAIREIVAGDVARIAPGTVGDREGDCFTFYPGEDLE